MARKLTRPMRWHEICRAALIIGVIDEYSIGESFELRRRILKRIAEGKVTMEKLGTGRTAPSLWRAYTEMPEMNGE
jgi:hypothetical protein